jgi:PPIC-type PPIASE domain
LIALNQFLNTAIVVLLGGVSVAQTTSVSHPNSAGPVTSASAYTATLPKLSVPEDAVVLTVNVCDPPAADACQTKLTREQFEKRFRTAYAGPRRPNERPANASGRADQYVRLLAYSSEARKQGLDKDPEFQQQMQEVEMQLLSTALQKKLKAETADPPEQALQDYYNKNIKRYEEVTVRSILIPRPPRSKAAAQTPEAPEGAAPWPEGEDVETQKIGDEARRQLAAGADPDQVQQAAYTAAKSTEPLPSTKPVAWRRNASFPAGEETMLFALKPGEVSPPVPNGSGLTIYRLESKRTIPLSDVTREVSTLYQMEWVQEQLNKFLDNAHPVLNNEYFETEKEAENRAREIEKHLEELREKGVPPNAKHQ